MGRLAGAELDLQLGAETAKPCVAGTPQPMRCLVEGVTLTGREAEVTDRHYILAERNKPSIFWEEYERVLGRPGWQCHTMPTKHDVMVGAPEALADLLQDISAG